jgi:hypothetical protein
VKDSELLIEQAWCGSRACAELTCTGGETLVQRFDGHRREVREHASKGFFV